MDIQTVSVVIAAVSVVIGVINSIMSNRTAAQQREAELFMGIYDRFHEQEFAKALWRSRLAPDFKSYNTFEDYWQHHGPQADLDQYSAGSAVFSYFSGIGLMVKRGLIDIALVDDLMRGRVMRIWEKWEAFIRAYQQRAEEGKIEGDPEIGHNFEYLYHALKQREQQ
jgi:hypothetical protein